MEIPNARMSRVFVGEGIVFQQILLGQLDTNILMNKTVSLPYKYTDIQKYLKMNLRLNS
jgi:hypothetical protein